MSRRMFASVFALTAILLLAGCAPSRGGTTSLQHAIQLPEPVVSGGEFFLAVGQALTLKLDHPNGAVRIAESIPGYHPQMGAVAFAFSRDTGMLSLTAMNCTDLDLDYDAYIQTAGGFEKTSIVGAYRGIAMFETWPDQFTVLKINNIRPASKQFDGPVGPGCNSLGKK